MVRIIILNRGSEIRTSTMEQAKNVTAIHTIAQQVKSSRNWKAIERAGARGARIVAILVDISDGASEKKGKFGNKFICHGLGSGLARDQFTMRAIFHGISAVVSAILDNCIVKDGVYNVLIDDQEFKTSLPSAIVYED